VAISVRSLALKFCCPRVDKYSLGKELAASKLADGAEEVAMIV
jgi:hypothetical protein